MGARAFYARHNPKPPFIAAAISTGSFFLLSILLFRPLGAAGIGVSNSVAFSLEALFLLVVLARQFPQILIQKGPLIRILLGSLLGGLIAFAGLAIFPGGSFIKGITSLSAGTLVTIPFIWPELRQVIRL